MEMGLLFWANDLFSYDPHKYKRHELFFICFELVCRKAQYHSVSSIDFYFALKIYWIYVKYMFFFWDQTTRIKIDHIVTNRQSR